MYVKVKIENLGEGERGKETQCDGLALSSVTSHFSNNSFIPKRTILIYTAKISGIKLWCKVTTSKIKVYFPIGHLKKYFF